jgi:hypothetical protein
MTMAAPLRAGPGRPGCDLTDRVGSASVGPCSSQTPVKGSRVDLAQLQQQLQAVEPWVWLAVAAAVVLVVAGLVGLLVHRHRRRKRLRRRYGAEYEHTAQHAGSRRRADQELVAREEARQRYEVRDLEPGERQRFSARWEALQASFVDDPWAAVRGVDELMTEVAVTKGYPDDGGALAGPSVDHPRSVDRYRTAAGAVEDAGADAGTEHLRHTVLAARDVFETMLGSTETSGPGPRTAFQALVDEDDEARSAPRRSSPSPLYGPDGRPLRQEPADRRR